MSDRPQNWRSLDPTRRVSRRRSVHRVWAAVAAAVAGFAIGLVWPADAPTPRGASVEGPEVPELRMRPVPELERRRPDVRHPEPEPLPPRIRAREALQAESLAQSDLPVPEARPSLVPPHRGGPQAELPTPRRSRQLAWLEPAPFAWPDDVDPFPHGPPVVRPPTRSLPPGTDSRITQAVEPRPAPPPSKPASRRAPAKDAARTPVVTPPTRVPELQGGHPVATLLDTRPGSTPLLPPKQAPEEKIVLGPPPTDPVKDGITLPVGPPTPAEKPPTPVADVVPTVVPPTLVEDLPTLEPKLPTWLADATPLRLPVIGGAPQLAFSVHVVPEPGTILLVGLGLVGLSRLGRRR